MDVLQDQLITIVGMLFTIVAGYATKQLKTYLERKGALDKLKSYEEAAKIAVNAVERIYQQQDGPEKFAKAKAHFAQSMQNQGLNISDQDLDYWIESAVAGMKEAGKEIKKGND